jgi:heptosyltransferase I
LSAIGDVTHVIPVVKTLQKHFPDCPITWAIGRLEHRLLSALPGVEFIEFDKKQGWRGIQGLRQQLKGRRFDVLLHMQLSFRANVVARFIPAKRRIGFDRQRSKEMHSWVVNERIPHLPDCHVLDGFMQFASHLGCRDKVMNWDLPMTEADQQFAHQLIKPGVKNVVISPCSSHPLRNWSVANYAALVDQVIERHGAHVILTGSPAPQERAFVAEIVRAIKHPVTNVAGQDTLKQLWCLLQQADLVISPDSGPLHMAGCVGTPVIGLLAASNFRRSGSYQYPELTVDKYPEACEQFLGQSVMQVKWGTKTEFPGAMDLIQVDHVLPVVQQVLQ